MQNKIDILGIEIDNFTVRESMLRVEEFLNGTGVKTIGTVTMGQLELAGNDEEVKACIRQFDLAVVGEKEILAAAGIRSGQRISEIVDHTFFREFAKRILRNKKTVFLLTDTEEELQRVHDKLKQHYERMQIAGSCSLESMGKDSEGIVNEINSASVDLVFSFLPTPQQEYFLNENRNKLDIRIWYGMEQDFMPKSKLLAWKEAAGRLIHKKKLKSRLHEYNKS